MDWRQALDIVVARTKHEPYRALCADDHPEHPSWRARMVEKAVGEPPVPANYPGLGRQALNLASAAGRIVEAAIKGEPILVPAEVFEARKALCVACPNWDAQQRRCTLCGCKTDAKLRGAQESCPADPPKWGRWTPSDSEI